jgi:outer membrane protein assembly factor BamB
MVVRRPPRERFSDDEGSMRNGTTKYRVVALAVVAGAIALVVGCGSSDSGATSLAARASAHVVATDAEADWPTYDRTPARSGISVSTPPFRQLAESWTGHLDGDVYAQPLVVGDDVYVATENDTVYELDATSGTVRWKRHLASPVPDQDLYCRGDIEPSGITGTPVIDTTTGRLYVVTFTASPHLHHTLWALSATTGKPVSHRTIDGPGSQVYAEQQRSALAILGTRVYVAYGGLDGDCGPYKGWVVGAPLAGTGALVTFVTPNQRQAGIWEPAGPLVSNDSLYVATGNGRPLTAVDDSDSVLRLDPTLQQEDRFTPDNYVYLSTDDKDLGSTSPALLADGLVFVAGKQGVGYVLDGTDLGGTGGALTSEQVCSGAFGGDAVDGDTVVVSCYDGLYTVNVTQGADGGPPTMRLGWSATGFQAGPPIIAGGIVWDETRGGSLVGYRLSNGTRVVSKSTPSPVTSFPSLSASGSRLFVPEGSEVVSYTGV